MKTIFAIDPGTNESACVAITEDFHILTHNKLPNGCVLSLIGNYHPNVLVIERVASYGMPVGKEVFETCEWVGRFTQYASEHGTKVEYVYRAEEKQEICHDSRANDATIRKALIDIFAKHDLETGKGTMKDPDYFHGFRADEWSAFAVAYTWMRKHERGEA